MSSICLYAQVIKKRRKNRVIKVERRLIIGTKPKMEQLLFESEDSSTINTSFIERLNLTIRRAVRIWGAGQPVIPGVKICLQTILNYKCVIIILFGRI